MKLAVVTHTKGTSPWYEQSVASVRCSLPWNAEHLIIPSDDFEAGRLASLGLAEYIAFVDDDDEVCPGALETCLRAIEETGVGVAFTDQESIDIHGNRLQVDTGMITPAQITCSPQAIHHLAVIRTSDVSHMVHGISASVGVGVDWMIKASAALQGGAVYVPMIGYRWRRHPSQHSVENFQRFNAAFDFLRSNAQSWMGPNSRVLRYPV